MCLGLEEERERGKLKELLSVGNYIAAHGGEGRGTNGRVEAVAICRGAGGPCSELQLYPEEHGKLWTRLTREGT